MKINWLKKIAFQGAHSAFTDLCEFNQGLFCCFRQATNHVSEDGHISIIKLNLTGQQLSTDKISLPCTDLRDPKLSVTPDGRLMLIAFAREFSPQGTLQVSKNYCWFSQDGNSWSSPHRFAEDNWWLWRIRWHQQQAYGFAYNREMNSINFYAGHPLRSFHLIKRQALSLAEHGKGYPNESDLQFYANQCVAIVRRDADSYSAQLGHSVFPFTRWRWTDLGFYLGGPVMQLLNEQVALVAGRVVSDGKLKTAVF